MASGEPSAYTRHSLLATHHAPFASCRMSDAASALTLQFLAWVAEAPRTYAQAMAAWRDGGAAYQSAPPLTCGRGGAWSSIKARFCIKKRGRREPRRPLDQSA